MESKGGEEESGFYNFILKNLVLPRLKGRGSSIVHVVDPAKRESEIDGSALEFCV